MKSQTTRVILLVTVALLLPIVPFVVIGELPGERWLSAQDDNAWLFALTGAGLLVVDVLLPVPSSIVTVLLGARLDFLAGWMSAWIGLTLGNLVGYGVGHLWPKRFAPEFPESPTLVVLFVSRPVPILAEAAVIAAGATRTDLLHTLIACALGNLIFTGILTASGSALLASNVNFIGVFLPLLIPAAGWMIWRWRAGQGEPEGHPTESP